MRSTLPGLAFLFLTSATAHAAVYDVGPGQSYANIGDVPLETLTAGDEVNIHWRAAPYFEKFVIGGLGTETEPIVIRGVPNGDGTLPVISGDGATTRLELSFWNEPRGLLKVGGSGAPDVDIPTHIIIENLDLRSVRPGFSFTDDSGNPDTYVNNAAALYVEVAQNLTVRNCIIHDSGNGLFIGVRGGDTQDILIEGNYIYDNGIEGSYYEHNSYTSALGITFQYNHYGPLRTGCGGNNLKDRSAGLVVRYNWIESGNRQLDLVDGEDHPTVVNDPRYGQTFVYGNVLVEPDGAGNGQMIHYGGDSGTLADYRKGTLYFFHNTVISTRGGNTTLVRLSTNDEHGDFRNNIVFTQNDLSMLSDHGVLLLSDNWLTDGWVESFEGAQYDGSITADASNLTGTDPGFVNFGGDNFRLAAGAAPIDQGGQLASAASAHAASREYVEHQGSIPRPLQDEPDLGAFEFCPAGGCVAGPGPDGAGVVPGPDGAISGGDGSMISGGDGSTFIGGDASTISGGDEDGSGNPALITGCGCSVGHGGGVAWLVVGFALAWRRHRRSARGSMPAT